MSENYSLRSIVPGLLLLSGLMLFNATALAGVAVIVNPGNSEASLGEKEIKKIFLGKSSKFPGGKPAAPVDQSEESAVRTEFARKVLKKSASKLAAYWSKMIFSGKGVPPKKVGNDADVIKHVANNPNAIGYVDSGAVNDSVKVVLTIP